MNSNQSEEFNKWLSFLTSFKEGQKNKELALEYFFYKFAKDPSKFYKFIEFFKNKLVTAKNSKLKKHLANQYLKIISQLCERFGLFEEKQSLDDHCFKIVAPKEFTQIDKALEKYKKESKKLIDKISEILEGLLISKKYNFQIKGRYKSIYSIHKKIQKKFRNTALNLKDIFAFRIILEKNSTKQCFEVLNILHDEFSPIVDNFKDYISIPKINGYQSLHTSLTNVISNLDLPIEVQISTQAMHDFAENGVAAHYLYAQEKKSKLLTEKEKMLINYFDTIAGSLSDEKTIYCFSYQGDIFKLEKGSSAADFAYHIHTNLGNKAKSAIVNGVNKELNYKIDEGDHIKILT